MEKVGGRPVNVHWSHLMDSHLSTQTTGLFMDVAGKLSFECTDHRTLHGLQDYYPTIQ